MKNTVQDAITSMVDVTVDGPKTERWVLEAKDCPALAALRIARLGIDSTYAPYQRVRTLPVGSFIMVAVQGSGRVLLDGRWQVLEAGWACMAPPRVLNAFQAHRSRCWRFLWMRYDEPGYVTPLVSAGSPVKLKADTAQLERLWGGLRSEWTGAADAKALHHWLELIHLQARRLAQPWHKHERLRTLWSTVEERLSEDWTLAKLAHEAHVSEEHFRRLCWKELGRSPMSHLTSLRIQAARSLLASGQEKQDFIAQQVGYTSAIAFARAFRRITGCLPSEYRSRI